MFLRYCEGRMKRGERMTRQTYNVYEGYIYNYICPDPARHTKGKRPKRLTVFEKGIGAIKLGQLTARRVWEFCDDLRNAGLSAPTTRKAIAALKAMLEYAISQDLIAVNAARKVRVIGRRDETFRKIVPPTKVAMRQLIDTADPEFRTQLVFAAITGVRAGELHALRWKHIDFEASEVTIETRVDAYGHEDVTKTAAGMRTIPLAAEVIVILKEWKLRARRKSPDDIVFPNRSGRYASHDNMVKRQFNPLFEKLAALHAKDPAQHPVAPARFNWHALRHFAISCWIEAGLAPKTIQTFAGHSSLSVTMDRYGHLFKSEGHRRAMDDIASKIIS
ncbi:MAG: site-specific integrase [Xanthobacteraceae bacterium]